MNNRPVRKPNRLHQYDYSLPGYYFITVCTKNRQKIFGEIVSTGETTAPSIILNSCGRIVDEAILSIPDVYHDVKVEKYVIMPNHVHLLLSLSGNPPLPSISQIIQQTKRRVSKNIGKPVWQEHFYDHVIRNEADYLEVWQYIDGNPAKWALDKYFQK